MRGMMESENEADIEYLVQSIKVSIRLVVDKLDIDCIDKNTENRLIDFCLNDRRCQKGQYNIKYLETLIERELMEAMW
jgi:hypothetical protein